MSQRAHVSSVAAIESFRADILIYLTKSKPVLEDAFDEITALREWVERDRRRHWEREVRRRTKELNDAQQALFSAKLLNLRAPTWAEQAAVTSARRALSEAEEKLRTVKKWIREFDNRVQPLLKEIEHVRTVFTRDAPAAVAFLDQIVKRLDEYAGAEVPVPTVTQFSDAETSTQPEVQPTADEIAETAGPEEAS